MITLFKAHISFSVSCLSVHGCCFFVNTCLHSDAAFYSIFSKLYTIVKSFTLTWLRGWQDVKYDEAIVIFLLFILSAGFRESEQEGHDRDQILWTPPSPCGKSDGCCDGLATVWTHLGRSQKTAWFGHLSVCHFCIMQWNPSRKNDHPPSAPPNCDKVIWKGWRVY